MPVPTSVKQLLETQNIAYQVSTTRNESEEGTGELWHQLRHQQYLRHAGAAKSLILQDHKGRIQVLIRADCLLDLSAVNQQFGREFTAVPETELRNFFDQHQLQSIPALPQIAGLQSVVDHRLLQPEELLLDAGADSQLLGLKQADFQQILTDATICDIAVPLAALEQPDTLNDDETQIRHSLDNFTRLRIKQRLEDTLELPPLPETAQRIIKLRVDPNADIGDLANIVETDPSLAAQVVGWAASPYYSAPGKIKSIHDAIVRVLGFDMVLNLALGLALGKTLNMPADGPRGATPYWRKAVYTATTVEALVTAIPREHRPSFGMAYLAGLLNNFGYLVLAEVFPPYFTTINRYSEANPQVGHQAIERHIIDITREQLAGWLMDLWNMPQEVVIALRYQNDPDYAGEHHEYAKLVYLAQLLLRQQGIGSGPVMATPSQLCSCLHLTPEQVGAAIDGIMESSTELNNIAAQMGG
ncbi:HDOD domain-containing protein [Exilibacterium tricleocarpae]|uniref:HDOD domain-containing protein n=1 Tax=Exilibacterium tricleocarpae TaxID=2591008 RepID=A0A545TZC5_9GAMM|nr:HDOD domain-containing protein [Exilibacterium tricleocarpae]TQV82565.1 HDOD domain-containing protein [Exilibacterium tricleocarpae]